MGDMVDMKRSPEEKEEATSPVPFEGPDYPYGLCICLCEDELEKLGLDNIKHGDLIHIHGMAKVTSFNKSDHGSRAELQITNMSAENEADEDKEAERSMKADKRVSKLYK